MQIFIKTITILTFLGGYFSLNASILNENLMTCQVSSNGKRNNKCRVYKGELASPLSNQWDSSFSLSYNFNCSPGKGRVKVVITSGGKTYPLAFGKKGTIKFTGKSKALLKDLSPKRTKRFLFKKGCQLVFSKAVVTPADHVKSKWRQKQSSLLNEKRALAALKKAKIELLEFKPAFSLLHTVLKSVSEDLGKNMKLRKTLVKLEQCSASYDSQSTLDKLMESEDLNLKELKSLMKLQQFICQLPKLDVCASHCGKQILNSKLDKRSINLINQINAELETGLQKAQKEIKAISAKIKAIDQQLRTLKQQLAK